MFKRTIVLSRTRILNSRNFPVIFLLMSTSPRETAKFGGQTGWIPYSPRETAAFVGQTSGMALSPRETTKFGGQRGEMPFSPREMAEYWGGASRGEAVRGKILQG